MSIEDHKRVVQEARAHTEQLRKLMNEHPELPVIFYSRYFYDEHTALIPRTPRIGWILSPIDLDIEIIMDGDTTPSEKGASWGWEVSVSDENKLTITRDFDETEKEDLEEEIKSEVRKVLTGRIRRGTIKVVDGDEFDRLIQNEVERINRACEPFWVQAIIV